MKWASSKINHFPDCGVTLINSEEDLQNFTRLACAFSPSFRRGRTFWRHDPDIELSHWLIYFAPRSFYLNQQKLKKSLAQSKKSCSLLPPYRHPTIWIVVYFTDLIHICRYSSPLYRHRLRLLRKLRCQLYTRWYFGTIQSQHHFISVFLCTIETHCKL